MNQSLRRTTSFTSTQVHQPRQSKGIAAIFAGMNICAIFVSTRNTLEQAGTLLRGCQELSG